MRVRNSIIARSGRQSAPPTREWLRPRKRVQSARGECIFEFIDHTADVAVRLRSTDEAELFRDAARALLAIILDPASEPVGASDAVPLTLESEDGEALLVDFLNEIIFLFDTRRFLAGEVDVKSIALGRPARIEAVLRGETYDPARHAAKTEVKAATFHGMTIARTPAGFEADVVFDL